MGLYCSIAIFFLFTYFRIPPTFRLHEENIRFSIPKSVNKSNESIQHITNYSPPSSCFLVVVFDESVYQSIRDGQAWL
jgi:hypothetical protein